ncbi:hypothetical protein [Companilactobacillus muriivasis]|uniref:hypothetical protein n=1 Tax=Companilactobacillus muriivasis TaxID=3081444 RepID=UPI0030C6AD38
MSIFIALGDLHEETKSLSRLKKIQAMYPENDTVTVFIGDYIDTFGPNSGFELLEKIHNMNEADPLHTVVLMGNHEQAAIDYFENPNNTAWLRFGGNETLKSEVNRLGGNQGTLSDREFVLNKRRDLINWVKSLPLTYQPGSKNKIVFTHAGLDLTLKNPIRDTNNYDRLWMRANYWYDPNSWGIFGRNKLGVSVVTGHTPNGKIMGRYSENQKPEKFESNHSPIYTIQYPNEMPRYLMDGGIGEGDPKILGNIGVFDGETGLLINALED